MKGKTFQICVICYQNSDKSGDNFEVYVSEMPRNALNSIKLMLISSLKLKMSLSPKRSGGGGIQQKYLPLEINRIFSKNLNQLICASPTSKFIVKIKISQYFYQIFRYIC